MPIEFVISIGRSRCLAQLLWWRFAIAAENGATAGAGPDFFAARLFSAALLPGSGLAGSAEGVFSAVAGCELGFALPAADAT